MPAIRANDISFALHNHQFSFNITGAMNTPIVVEACTNLASPVWIPVQTLTLTNGSFNFSEPAQMNGAGRYYRIKSY